MAAARRQIRLALAALAIACGLVCTTAGVAAADTGDPLAYYGGPVVHSMTGVLVDWGTHVGSVFTNPTSGDPGLLRFLAAASGRADVTGSVLSQYMDTSGHNSANQVSYGGQFTLRAASSAQTLQDSQVASQLVSGIESGELPSPAGDGMSSIYLMLFPAGTSVCGLEGCTGQAICSYHSSTYLPNGTHVLYAVLPDDTSGPMSQGCGQEATALRNQTSYLTHEWAEAVNDPLVTEARTMGPPLGWYDASCPRAASMCGEIADKCNQESTVQGGWTVQLLWSNLDRACLGAERRYGTPSVAFGPPPLAAVGLALAFSAAASDPSGNSAWAGYGGRSYSIGSGIASVTWSFGDGSQPVTGLRANHTFASPGVYPVSVTARDELGFASTSTRAIPVWGPLGAPAASTGAAALTGRRSARLTGSVAPAGAAVGYRFDYGIGRLSASTPAAGLGTRTGTAAASATLSGLAPASTYDFRLDVVVGGIVIPGAVHTFRTPAAAASTARSRHTRRHRRHHSRRASSLRRSSRRVVGALRRSARAPVAVAVPVAASPLTGQTLHGELVRGMLVRVSCPSGCRASVMAALRVGPASVPRALAEATVHVGAGGSAVVRLPFTPSARSWLARRRGAAFAVSAYAR